MMKLLVRLSLLKKCLIINTMIFKLNFYNEPNVQNYTQEIKETLICIISVIYLNIYLYIATTLFLVQPLWPLWIEHNSSQLAIISVSKVKHFFFNFYFYFILLYNTVLVLPYIDMSPPWVYMRFQTWTPLPPPSPQHPSGSSLCTSPKHAVSYAAQIFLKKFVANVTTK